MFDTVLCFRFVCSFSGKSKMSAYRHDYAMVPQQSTGAVGSVYFQTRLATNKPEKRNWEYLGGIHGSFHWMAIAVYAIGIGLSLGWNEDSASRQLEFFSFFHPSEDITVEMEHLSYFYLSFGIFFHLASLYDAVNWGVPSYFSVFRSADQILSIPFIIAQLLLQLGMKDIIAVMAFSALAAVAAMILGIQEHANAIREEQWEINPVKAAGEEMQDDTPTPGAKVNRLPFSRTTRYTVLSGIVWAILWVMILLIWGHVKARGDGKLPESYVTIQVWLNFAMTIVCLCIHIVKAMSKKPYDAAKTQWVHSEGVFAVFLVAWKMSHLLAMLIGTKYYATDKLQSYDTWMALQSTSGGSGGGS